MEKFEALCIIIEMQIKKVRYQLTPVRMGNIKRQYMTRFGKDRAKGQHLYSVGGNINYIAIMENNMEVPQKVKNRATI